MAGTRTSARSQGERLNTERLTTKSREVIKAAVATADQRGHATVEPWHLLLALLDTGGSTAAGAAARGRGQPGRRPPRRRPRRRAPARAPAAPASPSRRCPASSSTRSAPPSRSPGRSATSTSPPSTCWPAWPGSAARSSDALKDAGATEDEPGRRVPAGPRRRPAGHHGRPGAELPGAGEVRRRPDRSGPARARSTRSSAGTRRSAG